MAEPLSGTPSLPAPPNVPVPYLRFLLLKPGQSGPFRFLSPSWWACNTHFIEGRTFYCSQRTRPCDYCRQKVGFRWTAFCVVATMPGRFPKILSWHQHCHHTCPNLDTQNGGLHTQEWQVQRSNGAKNAPLTISWHGVADPVPMPPVEDVRVYLGRLWNVDLLREGV